MRRKELTPEERKECRITLEELNSRQHTPKELREIHKVLKKYGRSIPLSMRYPDLPFVLAPIVLMISLAVLALTR